MKWHSSKLEIKVANCDIIQMVCTLGFALLSLLQILIYLTQNLFNLPFQIPHELSDEIEADLLYRKYSP